MCIQLRTYISKRGYHFVWSTTYRKKILMIQDDHPNVTVIYRRAWIKKDTLARIGNRYADKMINRAIQNNHLLEKLTKYLTSKGRLRGRRGGTRTGAASKPSVRIFTWNRCSLTYLDYQRCSNKEAALWQCLAGDLPTCSMRRGIIHSHSNFLLISPYW